MVLARAFVAGLFVLALAPACVVHYDTVRPVASARGADVIECPPHMVDTESLGGGSYVVRGCNREARIACVVSNHYQVHCFRDDPPNTTTSIVVASPVHVVPPASTLVVPTTSSPESVLLPEFDRDAVRTALSLVSYKDCDGDGEGKLHLTLEPDGTVSDVRIATATLGTTASACVVARFKSLRVPRFKGNARTIAWSVTLDDDAPTPTAPKGTPM